MADFVVNINFDKSLFIAMLDKRSFFDQRMIGFSIKEQYKDENKIFLLALLNNILSMFFIESFGFGRGLGALDLRETKFKKDFKILNPELLSDAQKKEIIKAFQPIFNRDRLPLEKELQQKDRIDFELMLLKIYGLDKYYDTIKQTLLHLYKTRFAVKEKNFRYIRQKQLQKQIYFYIRFVMPMIFLKMSEFGMALVGFLHVIFMLKIKG